MTAILIRILPYPLIAVLLFNMMQRKYMVVGEGKRMATLLWSGIILLLYGAALVIRRAGASTYYLLPVLFLAGGLVYIFRNRFLVFRTRCAQCGDRLPISRTLFWDRNRCTVCEPQTLAELKEAQASSAARAVSGGAHRASDRASDKEESDA